VSPPEIAILGFGIGLGVAIGGACMATLRSRFSPRREVRITVAPNSITPRRASTLAYAESVSDDGTGPSTFGDERWPYPNLGADDVPEPEADPPADLPVPARTRVPSAPVQLPATAIAVPIGDGPGGVHATRGVSMPIGTPGSAAPDLVARAAAGESHAHSPSVARPAGAVALAARAEPPTAAPSPRRRSAAHQADHRAATVDACRAERVLVEERCAAAGAARERSRAAAERLRDLRNAYELLREQAERAHEAADPDAVTVAKDTLHRTFRAARDAASTAADMEAAARYWLEGVNNVNSAAREARSVAEATEREVREMLPRLERLIVEAETARNAAELADAGCRAAREILATCEEQEAGQGIAARPVTRAGSSSRAVSPMENDDGWDHGAGSGPMASDEADMTIVRVLRGDRAAGDELAARLAAGEPGAEPAWRVRIDALIAAVVSRAIDEGYLDLPDAGFWRPFTRGERREVVVALTALGFRYDGGAGFAEGRAPLQRDLALAVGYAGLDRMRIRAWPDDAGLGSLFADAAVAADEWLADRATDLSLGRMVDALGARADDLTDIWNAWGRVRPALIAAH
jgi:hypothetical protein